jgi:leucyl aminopeptidase (aminopeptidase T)
MFSIIFSYFSGYRWIIDGAIMVGILTGLHYYDEYEQKIGADKVQAAWDREKAESEAAQLNREHSLQTEKDNAIEQSEKHHQDLVTMANSAANSSKLLDATIAANNAAIARLTNDALNKYTTTLGAVLSDCQQKYTGLAKEADGHAADSLILQQSWPK